jgi:hypothetical protein
MATMENLQQSMWLIPKRWSCTLNQICFYFRQNILLLSWNLWHIIQKPFINNSIARKTSHVYTTKYLTFWMSKTHNSIVWIVCHNIQSSHPGIELRYHLTDGDIQPAEVPFFTLLTQYNLLRWKDKSYLNIFLQNLNVIFYLFTVYLTMLSVSQTI